MIYEVTGSEKISGLFDNWEETLIWSALQGIMGKIYVTDPVNPASAMIVLGDFCFLAGAGDRELVSSDRAWNHFVIMIPQNAEWEELIEEVHGKFAKTVIRYAMQKERNIFDREKLDNIVKHMPEGYKIRKIDKNLYFQCQANGWSADLVSQFKAYEEYERLGLGVVLLKDGVIVAGASSYSRYKDGIEIEIDTRQDYRRKGLATVCGAKLVLECLERDLYPSWDAQNLWSVALAEKLGYHFSHEYKAYEVWNDHE